MICTSSPTRSGGSSSVDRPADDLVSPVAEEAFGRHIPGLDDAVGILREDRVVGRLDDGRQPRQGSLGRLPRGEIAEHEDHSLDRAARLADRRAAVVDGDFAAVLGEQNRVVGQVHHGPQTQHLVDRAFHRLAGLLVEDPEHRGQRLAAGLAVFPTREALGLGVERR